LGDAVDTNELPKNFLAAFTQVRALVEQSKRPVMVPMSPVRCGFMTLSERAATVYTPDIPRRGRPGSGSSAKLDDLYQLLLASLGDMAPGQFLSNLMVPKGPAQKIRGYRTSLQTVAPRLDGADYIYDAAKKYVLTGTFRTNGLELQVLAFDTRVVKGFQPDATLAPGRTDPRMGNTRYLTEIRNVTSP
ncbi:hypothetical protein BGZ67_001363, partial [Mortierella alpina]